MLKLLRVSSRRLSSSWPRDLPPPQPRNKAIFQDIIWSAPHMRKNTGVEHGSTQILFGSQVSGLAHDAMYAAFSDNFDFVHHSAATVQLSAQCEKIVDASNPLYDTIKTLYDNSKFGLLCTAVRLGLPDMERSVFAVSAGHNFGKYLNASSNANRYEATDTYDKDKTFAEVTYMIDESTGREVTIIEKEVSHKGEKDVALLELEVASPYFMVRGEMPPDLKEINYAHFIGYRGETQTVDAFKRKVGNDTLDKWFGAVGEQSLVGVSRQLLDSANEEAKDLTGSTLEQYDNLMTGFRNGVVWQDDPNSWEIKLATPGLGGHSGSGGTVLTTKEYAKQSRSIMWVYTGSDHENSRGTIIPREYENTMATYKK